MYMPIYKNCSCISFWKRISMRNIRMQKLEMELSLEVSIVTSI